MTVKHDVKVANMVSFDVVKDACDKKQTSALKRLVEEMEKYGMSRIELHKFVAADKYVMCPVCKKEEVERGKVVKCECGAEATEGDKCFKCRKVIPLPRCKRCLDYEKSLEYADKVSDRWQQLALNLEKIAPGKYDLSISVANPEKRELPSASLSRTETINGEDFKVNIYRDYTTPRGSGYYISSSHTYFTAVSPDWTYKRRAIKKIKTDINENKVDLVKLAKKVHDKAQSVFDAKERELDFKAATQIQVKDTIELIKRSVKGATDVKENYTYYPTGTHRQERNKDGYEGKLGGLRFHTYDGKKFSIRASLNNLSPRQLKKFVETIRTFQKEVLNESDSKTEED